MATAVVRFTAAAVTDRGRKRSSNEDAYGYSIEHGVYVVCDGMGGAAAGEIASSIAVEEVLRLVTERVSGKGGEGQVEAIGAQLEETAVPVPQIVEEVVHAANEAIYMRAQRNAKLSGMGTTLVGILTTPETVHADSTAVEEEDRKLWILNVSDSRCYRLRGRQLQLCTEDHSLVEEQIRLGKMTRLQAARSPLRNVITRALGTQPRITADVMEHEAEPGDLFLLCSDGLTRELTDERIESILNTTTGGLNPTDASLEELCNRLIQAANKAGGNDNITCLIVRVDS